MKQRIATALTILALAHVSSFAAQSPSRVGTSNDARDQSISAPTRASPDASTFYLLMAGNSDQQPTFWAERLKDASITPEEINKIRAYAKYAREANLEFQKGERDKMCAGKDSLTSLNAVAAALTKMDASNAMNIEQLGKEASKSLGERIGKLLIAASTRTTFMVSETDYKNVLTTQNIEPVSHIQNLCSKSSVRPAP